MPDIFISPEILDELEKRAEKAEAERDQFERERGEYRNSFHDKIIECSKAEAKARRLDQVISGFYAAIKHGDDAHKEWLLEKINSYVAAALSDTKEVP